jgi:hypothetical protein
MLSGGVASAYTLHGLAHSVFVRQRFELELELLSLGFVSGLYTIWNVS